MGYGGGVGGVGGGVLVDRTCWRANLRWPLAVSINLGSCLRTRLDVRPGQVVKKPAYMALQQVSIMGLKQARRRNCTRAGSVFMWYTLFAKLYDWRGVWAALVIAYSSTWNAVGTGE